MKVLNGSELAHFIKNRQANEVRILTTRYNVIPKLAIIVTIDNPVIDLYVKLKERYGNDLGVEVEVFRLDLSKVSTLIKTLNADPTIHGIIIQLPISDIAKTDEVVNLVSPIKDVDALGIKSIYDPATPKAILWLLAGYNINLNDKKVLLIGRGRLVGKPLEKMLIASKVDVSAIDRETPDAHAVIKLADIIITATGQPKILTSAMIKDKAVVVDAGVTSESGKTVGDLDGSVYERSDLTVTPLKGGVGPLTVCALFDNLIIATSKQINQK